MKEFVIAFDQSIYDAAKERATLLMTATEANELKPEGWIAGGSECNYCPFTKACGRERSNLPFADVPVEPQFAAEIADKVLAIKSLEGQRDDADALMRELQDELKARLREKGVRKIPGIVTWSSVKGRFSYDNL